MTTVPQLRAARALLGWSQDDLAARSGISKPTIARLELGSGELTGYASTRDKVVGALEAAGVIFVAENGEGPGVRLRKGIAADERQPASPEKLRANAAQARAKATKATDRVLGCVDASEDEKAGRRSALTDEPALVMKARAKNGRR